MTIAEIAQGYEGKPLQAALLVRAAASAGADAVKLQLVYADELCTPDYKHYALFKSLEMPDIEWVDLNRLCRELGVGLYLDVFGERSLALAARLGVSGVKVHSTDMGNIGLLRKVGACGVSSVILSAGGCLAQEIDAALDEMGAKPVVLMHGFQGYPTAIPDNQLARLVVLRERYGNRPTVRFGFADHVPSDDPMRFALSCAAAGMGVAVIEKHITLGVAMKLEDHESALNPDEFAAFVAQLRGCAQAIGESSAADEDFGMSESELRYRHAMHKHIVAAGALAGGTILAPELLAMKRTTAREAVFDPARLVGKRLLRAVRMDEAITQDMVSD